MIGIGLLFVVVWMVDRRRWYALSFAGAVTGFTLAGLVLSIPLGTAAAASSIHGVLFPIAVALLIDGVLRRRAQQFRWMTNAAFVLVLAVVVCYFAYPMPLLIARIVTQNVGMAVLVWTASWRLWRSGVTTTRDRVCLAAMCLLGAAVMANLVCAALSDVPRELLTDADLTAYLASALEYALIVATGLVLPGFVATMLAVTVVDVIEDLRAQRDRDELTGVLNRWGFNHRAERMSTSAGCALALIDLDRFKRINDLLGHAAGDAVLVMVARELSPGADESVVGRLGGEEFAVLLPGADLDRALVWAEATRRRIESLTITAGEHQVTVTASIGITASRGPGVVRLPDLLEMADKALYTAKAGGRNRIAAEVAGATH